MAFKRRDRVYTEMFVAEGWTFMPKFPLWKYIPDGTICRNKNVARWYAFLKWRLDFEKDLDYLGAMREVRYTFDEPGFPIFYYGKKYYFRPDFEITYNKCPFKEYHSLDNMIGKHPYLIQTVLKFYPTMRIRVIEPYELKQIVIWSDPFVKYEEVIQQEGGEDVGEVRQTHKTETTTVIWR